MARKGKAGAKKANPVEKQGTSSKPTVNRIKKDKNVFKVNDAKSKKKPREVQVKLKKLKETVRNKQESVDIKFKGLHNELVDEKPPQKITKKKNKNTKTPVNQKQVENNLEQMQV